MRISRPLTRREAGPVQTDGAVLVAPLRRMTATTQRRLRTASSGPASQGVARGTYV
ncbi:hypothetical protein [Micromonospora sp. WMMD987]|uniref:hypothetical protein n=1 Tax=Micromonospora sp. WMMD987 TaxID=3016089 RepID=UPI00249C8D59|nr:hypothetical protein [Micromonospora sp. WMMD987]WFE96534.1 hypothetical protein O7612_06450 [Micromonospora sp. WMMD987]